MPLQSPDGAEQHLRIPLAVRPSAVEGQRLRHLHLEKQVLVRKEPEARSRRRERVIAPGVAIPDLSAFKKRKCLNPVEIGQLQRKGVADFGGTADAAVAAESVEEVTASELGTAQLELLVGEQLGERVLPGEDRIERELVVKRLKPGDDAGDRRRVRSSAGRDLSGSLLLVAPNTGRPRRTAASKVLAPPNRSRKSVAVEMIRVRSRSRENVSLPKMSTSVLMASKASLLVKLKLRLRTSG